MPAAIGTQSLARRLQTNRLWNYPVIKTGFTKLLPCRSDFLDTKAGQNNNVVLADWFGQRFSA
jgi:hypothetical protein